MSRITEPTSRTVEVVVGGRCGNCGDEWGTVYVHGWYGGTIDTLGGSESLLLCDACARRFLAEWLPGRGPVGVSE